MVTAAHWRCNRCVLVCHGRTLLLAACLPLLRDCVLRGTRGRIHICWIAACRSHETTGRRHAEGKTEPHFLSIFLSKPHPLIQTPDLLEVCGCCHHVAAPLSGINSSRASASGADWHPAVKCSALLPSDPFPPFNVPFRSNPSAGRILLHLCLCRSCFCRRMHTSAFAIISSAEVPVLSPIFSSES